MRYLQVRTRITEATQKMDQSFYSVRLYFLINMVTVLLSAGVYSPRGPLRTSFQTPLTPGPSEESRSP